MMKRRTISAFMHTKRRKLCVQNCARSLAVGYGLAKAMARVQIPTGAFRKIWTLVHVQRTYKQHRSSLAARRALLFATIPTGALGNNIRAKLCRFLWGSPRSFHEKSKSSSVSQRACSSLKISKERDWTDGRIQSSSVIQHIAEISVLREFTWQANLFTIYSIACFVIHTTFNRKIHFNILQEIS